MGSGPHGDLEGIIPIPVTPFTGDDALDVDGLVRQVQWCIESGAHGICYPGVVSEFYTLTDSERHRAVEACVQAVDGRVPVVVGVSAPSTAAAAALATHAGGLGVDAVMTMVPFVQHFFSPSPEFAIRHTSIVAEAARVPVVLQNARIGHPMSTATLASITDAVPSVRYVKQETSPATQDLSRVLEHLGPRILGAFGGIGGVYLTNELDRGALGSMPSPAFADRIIDAHGAYRAEGADACQSLLDPLGTLFTRELLYNVALIKAVLRERGILDSTAVRIASPELDRTDLDDLRRLLRTAELA